MKAWLCILSRGDAAEPETLAAYDAMGRQTSATDAVGATTFTYDATGQLTSEQVSGLYSNTLTRHWDAFGRNVDYQETRDGQVATHFRFVYDNFLCVQRLDAANDNAVRTDFVWNLTESIATRPLVFQPASGETAYYFHDGNKNVSEVFYHALQNGIAAHYDYAPFGAATRPTRVTTYDILSVPLRILIIS